MDDIGNINPDEAAEHQRGEEYVPATDPGGNRPGGDRVRFEQDSSGIEQSIFGGSAAEIEESIIKDTYNNSRMIGAKILGVKTVKGDLGSGTLQELQVRLDSGLTVTITGIGMEIKVT